MAEIRNYERVLKQDESVIRRSRILMTVLYGVIFTVFFVLAVFAGLPPALLILAPLSTVIAALITWKYTRVEYEYSFFGGVFTFSKIYSGSSRSLVLEADISAMSSVTTYTTDVAARIKAERGAKVIDGLPSGERQNPCVCAFEDEHERKIYFIFECDEQSARIFKHFNPTLTDGSIFLALRTSNK